MLRAEIQISTSTRAGKTSANQAEVRALTPAAVRGARLILLARSGHSFFFQKPALVARTVLDFLDAKS